MSIKGYVSLILLLKILLSNINLRAMAKTQPVNPDRKINLLKRILVYPQVSAFSVVKTITPFFSLSGNYRARSAGF